MDAPVVLAGQGWPSRTAEAMMSIHFLLELPVLYWNQRCYSANIAS